MSEEKDDDKPFEATEQKLRKAREKGDFPRSVEINATLAYLGALIAGGIAIEWAVPGWLNRAKQVWSEIGHSNNISGITSDHLTGIDTAQRIWGPASLLVLMLMSVPAAVILTGIIMQRGLVFVPSKLAFDFSRINPVKSIGQKFGKSGLMTFAISSGKAIGVSVGGWFLFASLMPVIAHPDSETAWLGGLETVLSLSLILAFGISVVFAIADYSWKYFDFRRRNRMSLKDLKDEMKDSEGDPHMKAARHQKSVEVALSSMLADIAKADVIIVNPTHYAVALEWKRGSGRAPVCVAKGIDAIALRIRERAKEHAVPIWPDPPCARALYATVNIGAEIDPDHFAPVAAAIRFAEAMRFKARKGW